MKIDERLADEQRREKLTKAYLATFSTESGRLVLEDLRFAFGDRTSFTPDPYITAFNEGGRAVYLKILKIMEEAREQKTRQEEAD